MVIAKIHELPAVLQYYLCTFRIKRKVTVTMNNMKVIQKTSHFHPELVKVPGLVLLKRVR